MRVEQLAARYSQVLIRRSVTARASARSAVKVENDPAVLDHRDGLGVAAGAAPFDV
jgi:hypothetical protein